MGDDASSTVGNASAALRAEFIAAATWHGDLARAEELLRRHPSLADGTDIHLAAILGDDESVRRLTSADPSLVSATAPPYGATPLVLLCLSKYLRLDPSRGDALLRAARALLDAGADANSGFTTTGAFPEHETALYGAAGVAQHEAMTRLLLERGADPNDPEVVYHSPETHDLGAMKAVVETGRLTRESLVLMLIRKHDWHDHEGVRYLLEHGAAANDTWRPGFSPLHHAIQRDNSAAIVDLLMQHGADPAMESNGVRAAALAARRGRGDLLALFARYGRSVELTGADALIAGCARGDAASVRALAARDPSLVEQVRAHGGELLAQFAGTSNAAGIALLLDLGIPVDARYSGDGYFGIPPHSTALHVAAWKAWPDAVDALLARGAAPDALDAQGNTPLMLAVRATVDSYWTERRSTRSIKALLEAGADGSRVTLPTGYPDADELLRGPAAGASPDGPRSRS